MLTHPAPIPWSNGSRPPGRVAGFASSSRLWWWRSRNWRKPTFRSPRSPGSPVIGLGSKIAKFKRPLITANHVRRTVLADRHGIERTLSAPRSLSGGGGRGRVGAHRSDATQAELLHHRVPRRSAGRGTARRGGNCAWRRRGATARHPVHSEGPGQYKGGTHDLRVAA